MITVKDPENTDMKEAAPKKKRMVVYNTYTDNDRRRQFFSIQEELITPTQAANVYPETTRKWKTEYNKDPEKNIPMKKKQIVHQIG